MVTPINVIMTVEKLQCTKKNLFWCQCDHHKSYMDWTQIIHGPPWL